MVMYTDASYESFGNAKSFKLDGVCHNQSAWQSHMSDSPNEYNHFFLFVQITDLQHFCRSLLVDSKVQHQFTMDSTNIDDPITTVKHAIPNMQLSLTNAVVQGIINQTLLIFFVYLKTKKANLSVVTSSLFIIDLVF